MAQVAVDLLAGTTLSSRVIELGLGHHAYSHAASVLADSRYLDARDTAMFGVPAGVHIRMPGWERSLRRVRYSFEVTQDRYDAWEANLRAKIGTPYSRRAIWGFITGHEVTVKGEWICSMVAVNALQHIGIIRYPLSVQAHEVNPTELGFLMEQAGATLTDVQAELLDLGDAT